MLFFSYKLKGTFQFHTPLKGTMTLLVIMSSCEEKRTKYQKLLGANSLKSRKKMKLSHCAENKR